MVSGQALVSRHNSLSPISGFAKKKKSNADMQKVESSPQRWNGESGGQWAEGKSQASGFSAQVPKDGYFFRGGGGAGSQGYEGGNLWAYISPLFLFPLLWAASFPWAQEPKWKLPVGFKATSGKSKKILEGSQKRVSSHACHMGISSISVGTCLWPRL